MLGLLKFIGTFVVLAVILLQRTSPCWAAETTASGVSATLYGGGGSLVVPNNEREPEHTIVQGDVKNPNLEVRLYGDKAGTRTVLQPYNDDITYVMSLLCTSNWAITLRDRNNDVDLSGLATIKWRTRVSGFHLLRPVLKLADGTWLIGDKAVGLSTDWVESEIQLYDVRWRNLDITQVVEGREAKWVDNPDLSRVEEIGFTDLMRGAGHGSGGGSRVDWIQVTGKPVPRAKR